VEEREEDLLDICIGTHSSVNGVMVMLQCVILMEICILIKIIINIIL